MGILFLTVKQERCSDLLLWSAAWLLPPLRLMQKLMLTTATATALATEDLATLVSDTPVLATVLVLAMEDTVTPVLATLTARGRLRPSPRLMPSTDTELTPTLLATVTPPLPLPTLPSLPLSLLLLPPLPPTPLPPLPSATPVSDTPVSDTRVSDTLVSDTLVSATLPPTATATVWEPTELDTELTTDKQVQLSSRSST